MSRYLVNGIEVKSKNRVVLEVVRQYIQQHPNVSYNELKNIFYDKLQGSIGVIKNESDMNRWESDGRKDNRDKRFFTKPQDILKLKNENIYVCTEWGDSGTIHNFSDFIEYSKKELNFDIENLEDKGIEKYQANEEINKKEKKVIVSKNNEHRNNNNIHIKNIILYGPPGVGKTHNINKLIKLIEENENQQNTFKTIKNNKNYKVEEFDDDLKSRVKFVTFHQNFGYEDFIEGFRPNKKGKIKLEDGIFKQIALDAKENSNKNYYLIIDEINRGNISKIFGELITLIEESKRDNLEVTLPYSKEHFRVPSNLFIIGTMNSTDKSIALIDIALRRRFTFLKMEPNEELVSDIARDYFIALNSKIEEKLGSDFKIGHSYFMDIKTQDDLDFVKSYKIQPLLEEYFYGDSESLKDILDQIQ